MKDIIARLTDSSEFAGDEAVPPVAEEAAQVIDRLRELVAKPAYLVVLGRAGSMQMLAFILGADSLDSARDHIEARHLKPGVGIRTIKRLPGVRAPGYQVIEL